MITRTRKGGGSLCSRLISDQEDGPKILFFNVPSLGVGDRLYYILHSLPLWLQIQANNDIWMNRFRLMISRISFFVLLDLIFTIPWGLADVNWVKFITFWQLQVVRLCDVSCLDSGSPFYKLVPCLIPRVITSPKPISLSLTILLWSWDEIHNYNVRD